MQHLIGWQAFSLGNFQRVFQLAFIEIGGADGADFAFIQQVFIDAKRIGLRGVFVEAVREIEVDIIRLQAAEGVFDFFTDPAR